MLNINLWESHEDIGIQDFRTRFAGRALTLKLRIEEVLGNEEVCNLFIWKKQCKYYYGCTYTDEATSIADICHCFKTSFNRTMIFNTEGSSTQSFDDINLISNTDHVALEEHSQFINIFYHFEDGEKSEVIRFRINEKETNSRDEFADCSRECIRAGYYRVVFGTNKLAWSNEPSPLNSLS